jgi:hypothetical protein
LLAGALLAGATVGSAVLLSNAEHRGDPVGRLSAHLAATTVDAATNRGARAVATSETETARGARADEVRDTAVAPGTAVRTDTVVPPAPPAPPPTPPSPPAVTTSAGAHSGDEADRASQPPDDHAGRESHPVDD